jgi:hypothetical protein
MDPISIISPFSMSPLSPTFSSFSTISPTFSTFSFDSDSISYMPGYDDNTIVNLNAFNAYNAYNLLNKPNVASVNLMYSRPIISMYNDLNADKSVQQRISDMIRLKTLDKWLYEDLKDVLAYFKISNGVVDVIDSLDNYKPSSIKNESDEKLDKIVEFIENFFLTKKTVHRILEKYIKESNTEWVKIPHAQYYVKQLIGEKLVKMAKQAIIEKNRLKK